MDDEAAAERLESGASVVEFVLTDSMMTSSVNYYLGTEINMLETFILKDNYSCTITVQASSDEKISQLLSFFVPIQ